MRVKFFPFEIESFDEDNIVIPSKMESKNMLRERQ